MQCRRCTDGEVVRLKKTRRRDNDVYRCTGCGLIFSPASSQASSQVKPDASQSPRQSASQSQNGPPSRPQNGEVGL